MKIDASNRIPKVQKEGYNEGITVGLSLASISIRRLELLAVRFLGQENHTRDVLDIIWRAYDRGTDFEMKRKA